MTEFKQSFTKTVENCPPTSMAVRQDPLMALYGEKPESARISDGARTSSENVPAHLPLYGEVFAGHVDAPAYPVGVHKAVGGDGDFPVPGDILSAAIASCIDSCVRIIANRLNIELQSLAVNVEAHMDVRGTLRVDNKTPVGFQNIEVTVDLETVEDVPEAHIDVLLNAAEYSCVIIQTLRNSPEITVRRGDAAVKHVAA